MNTLKRIAGVSLGVFYIFLVCWSFIYSGQITRVIDKVLKLRINPDFTGGETLARFNDPLFDDDGAGGLTYPLHPAFAPEGLLDLVAYTVKAPVRDAKWGTLPSLWQIEISLNVVSNAFRSPLPFSQAVIHIYIDVDGAQSGSTGTAYPRCELVTFDPRHPWDYFVEIDGFEATLAALVLSADGTYTDRAPVYFSAGNNTVSVQIPLSDPNLKRVLDGRDTYHYVFVGACDQLASGHFMPVKETAGMANGGGAKSRMTPRIYDYLAPAGMDQHTVLSSFDESNFVYATVYPVRAATNLGTSATADFSALIREYAGKSRSSASNNQTAAATEAARLAAAGAPDIEIATAFFNAGDISAAKTRFAEILSNEPGNPQALAYYGSILAMEGGESRSAGEAVRLVNLAYDYLDKAVAAASTGEEILAARLNRGNVSLAVPDEVFGKSLTGAEDFLEAVKTFEETGADPSQIADCYLKAGLCYRQAGQNDRAEIYINQAAQSPELPDEDVLTLLKLGYLPKAVERE